jgi:hypothetical protein
MNRHHWKFSSKGDPLYGQGFWSCEGCQLSLPGRETERPVTGKSVITTDSRGRSRLVQRRGVAGGPERPLLTCDQEIVRKVQES